MIFYILDLSGSVFFIVFSRKISLETQNCFFHFLQTCNITSAFKASHFYWQIFCWYLWNNFYRGNWRVYYYYYYFNLIQNCFERNKEQAPSFFFYFQILQHDAKYIPFWCKIDLMLFSRLCFEKSQWRLLKQIYGLKVHKTW